MVEDMQEQENKKNVVDEKKRVLKKMEKSIRDTERKISQKKINSIGKLAVKAKLDEIDLEILYGAFVDISIKISDDSYKSSCLELARKQQHPLNGNRVAISFNKPPSLEIKEQLKNLSFKWNRFRGEFYGTCEQTTLSNILKDVEHKIEVIG